MDLNTAKITTEDKNTYGLVSALDILNGDSNENKLRFDKLPNHIADKHNEVVEHIVNNVYTKTQVDTAINQKIYEIGTGDMSKAVFDKDNDGVIDNAMNAEKLGGKTPDYYAVKEDVMNKAGGSFTGDIIVPSNSSEDIRVLNSATTNSSGTHHKTTAYIIFQRK